MPAMFKWSSLLPALVFAASASGQAPPSALDIANLQEDVRGLTQRVNDLNLRVEQLEHQSTAPAPANEAANQGYATLIQLNAAVAELNHSIEAATAASKSDTLDTLSAQMQKLVRQVNAALARNHPVEGPADAAAIADLPKTGISYVVQKGDTVELIAKKTGAKAQDIIRFNKLADPSLIQVGQSLFIPGGK
jgi:LysM repeat protein